MVRTDGLGLEAVVSMSTRMKIMEEQMKAMTEGFNSLKKEVQKETAGAEANHLVGVQQEQVERSKARAPCFLEYSSSKRIRRLYRPL